MNWYKQIKVSQAQNQAIYEDPAQKQQDLQYKKDYVDYLNQTVAALQKSLSTATPVDQPKIQLEIKQKQSQAVSLQEAIAKIEVELQWIAARNNSNQKNPPKQVQPQQNKAPVDWTNPFTNWSNQWQAKHQQRFNRPTR